MTITLMMPPETQQRLIDRARRAGTDVATLACELIERGLNVEPSLDEILAPFQQQVAVSGASEEELDAFFEDARSN